MDYNILIADFAGKNRICMTDTLYQYDYGQKLKIENVPALPQTFEAHFSNVQHGGVSITVVGMDGIVDIPNTLLATGKRIYCWIYVTEPGSGETEYQVLIPVQARPMPEYYDVTDVGVFDSVVQQVGDYAATATAAATSATESAAAAATSASEAAASASAAETAKTAAETAQGKAEDAQAAAETAAQTATEKAQQTAQDAAQAASDAGRAESAAQSAKAAQTGAESAKTAAQTAAQGAATSASAASASAASAGQAATSAAQSATAAAGSATTAQGAARTATTKASEASASASAAAASETAAQTAQTGAETAATNAGQSASTATTKAAEAAQSAANAAASETAAEAAATRAEQAAASLVVDDALSDTSTNPVQNKVITGEFAQVKNAINSLMITDTASGAIAYFRDGAAMPVESLSVEMNPIQDLNGQDAPYPAGGGKNLFDKSTVTSSVYIEADGTIISTAGWCVSDYIAVSNGDYVASGYSLGGSGVYLAVYDANKNYVRSVAMPTGAGRSTNVTIVTGESYVRMSVRTSQNEQDTAQLEKGSTPTAYAPYSNICPITGRESVTAWRTGINVWDEGWEYGLLNINGSVGESSTRITTKNFVPVIPGESYCMRITMSGRGRGAFYADDKTLLTYYSDFPKTQTPDVFPNNGAITAVGDAWYFTFIAPPGAKWMKYTLYPNAIPDGISINYPSTDHDYHAYDGQSVTVQLGQTVYGGTLDVVSGKLTVDRAMVTYDGTENWFTGAISGGVRYRMALDSLPSGIKFVTGNTEIPDVVTNLFLAVTANETWYETNGISMQTSYGWRIYCEAFNTPDAAPWKAYLAEHPLTVAYKLARPLTIALDPVTLSTLKGDNNVWSDADSVSVEYVADPKLYIDKKITAAVAALA